MFVGILLKAVLPLVIVTMVSGAGYFGYDYLTTKNKILEQNLQKIESVVETQNKTINTMEKNLVSIETAQKNLNTNFKKIENDTSKLSKLFSNHDFKNLVEKKPNLIENRVNKKTEEVFQNLRDITTPQKDEDNDNEEK